MAKAEASLAHRIASALRKYHAFIFQRGVDDPSTVLALIRDKGLTAFLDIRQVTNDIYVVLVKERPCEVNCKHNTCRENSAPDCIEKCKEDCLREVIEKIAAILASEKS